MSKQLNEVVKVFHKSGGTFVNSGIVLATVIFEQVVTVSVYICPCVSVSQLSSSCNATLPPIQFSCIKSLNFSYGACFIFGPAAGLFVFGLASNINTWKILTGCLQKSKSQVRETKEVLRSFLTIISYACVSPLAWICVALLDGRFVACAITPLPYDVDGSSSQFANCEAVAVAKVKYTSNNYNNHRTLSQIIGWSSAVVFAFIGFAVYAILKCHSPLTYYHNLYMKLYMKNEEAEFEDEMQIKTQANAEGNVRRFMEEQRAKELWDRISTVFKFHRSKDRSALYSKLHEWCLEEDKTSELKETTLNGDATEPMSKANTTNDVTFDV